MTAASTFVSTVRLGPVTLSQIDDGFGGWHPRLSAPEAEWRAALPQADATGYVENNHYSGLIQIGGHRILIDTGFDDPGPRSPWMPPKFRRTPGVVAGLATLGVRPEEITHVLFTHFHGDHVAGSIVDDRPRFPRARHFIGRADYEAAVGAPADAVEAGTARPLGVSAIHLGGLDRSGVLELVDGDREIVPGVTMIHAPGESPGHSVIRVAAGEEVAFFTGDLFHYPCEVEHLGWFSPDRDPISGRRSRERLLAEAVARNALVTYSHAPFPAWGRVSRVDSGYRWTLL